MKPEDIKLIALLDTETTGLDPKKDELIEIACVLYDVPSAQIVEALLRPGLGVQITEIR